MVSNYDVLKEVSKNIGKKIWDGISILYTCPTYSRKNGDGELYIQNDIHFSICMGTMFGMVANTLPFALTGEIINRLNFNSTDHNISIGYSLVPLFLPLLTNSISGLYEYYNFTKKKMKKSDIITQPISESSCDKLKELDPENWGKAILEVEGALTNKSSHESTAKNIESCIPLEEKIRIHTKDILIT
ncbi:MAG: hypothetical protein KJ623_01690, partial [Nanoarchaeota archaeon]|nr:hypothetical protein [Nanoarchaeota archaeon]